MVKIIRILTGIALIFVITSVNGIAGYAYSFGAVFESGFGLLGIEKDGDPRVVVEVAENGKKRIRPKNGLAALSLMASTKIGAFGIFLLSFLWLQFAAGILLLVKNRAGVWLFTFLMLVALGGLFAEITGAILTSSFGILNAIGSLAALILIIVSIAMYRENIRTTIYNNA